MRLGDEENISGSGDQVFKSQIILRSAEIVNDTDIIKGDILIEGGIIKQISQNIRTNDDHVRIINCDGKYVIPGGIDVNTHFMGKSKNVTSNEDFNSGSNAALWGGTTFFINITNPCESSKSLISEFNQMKEIAKTQSCCDYTLCVSIRNFNEDIEGQMKVLVNECGVNSFEISLRDSDSNLHDDGVAYDFFKFAKKLGVLILVHTENGRLVNKRANYTFDCGITGPEGHHFSSNEEIELASISRIIAISEETNCPILFINVMSSVTSSVIAKAKNKSALIYGETLGASLAINGLHYFDKSWIHAASFVCEPPLTNDIYGAEHLMRDLSSGCLDITGSNHCKFTIGQRKVGKMDFRKIPSGITGVAERMMIVWDKGVNAGIIDVCKFVAITSTNAARLFNIYPRKGALKEGSDADILIWDPKLVKPVSLQNSNDNSDVSIFKNINSQGAPSIVITNGIVVCENDTLNTRVGSGRFFKLDANNPFMYRHVALKDKIEKQRLKAVSRDMKAVDFKEDEKLEITDNDKTTINDDNVRKGQRPTTRCGGRNMQDSTFSLSGAQVDDNKPNRPGIRSQQPPGGVSTNLW